MLTGKWVARGLLVLIILTLLFIILTFGLIYKDVRNICRKAQFICQEDCPNSLVELIQSSDHTYREKNTAIWALGQMANKNSLTFLKQLDETIPEQTKCNRDQVLCKYEIKKAIKWCTNGNLTSWMYRNQINW